MKVRYLKISSRLFFAMCIGAATLVQQANAEPAAERQYVDGTVVASQIRNQLQADGFSPITQINVEADDSGEVKLRGVAASDAEAARAVALAKDVKGVMAVQSEIIVKRIQ